MNDQLDAEEDAQQEWEDYDRYLYEMAAIYIEPYGECDEL